MSEEALAPTFDGPEDLPDEAVEVVETPEVAEVPAAPEKEPEEDSQALIREQAFKARQAKREADEARHQLEELQRRVAQYEQPVRPNIPPPVDPYDENAAQKQIERDALIAQAARWDANQEILRQQQEHAQRTEQAKAEQARMEKVNTYTKQASTLGITEQELAAAGKAVAQFIPNNSQGAALVEFILEDDRGPEITAYLAKNPIELAKIVDMSPLKAAAYIEGTIKPASKRPPPNLAPEPVENLRGSAIAEAEYGPKGATYE